MSRARRSFPPELLVRLRDGVAIIERGANAAAHRLMFVNPAFAELSQTLSC